MPRLSDAVKRARRILSRVPLATDRLVVRVFKKLKPLSRRTRAARRDCPLRVRGPANEGLRMRHQAEDPSRRITKSGQPLLRTVRGRVVAQAHHSLPIEL